MPRPIAAPSACSRGCFWHIADVPLALTNVCFEGKNGHDAVVTPFPLMTQSGHVANCSRKGPSLASVRWASPACSKAFHRNRAVLYFPNGRWLGAVLNLLLSTHVLTRLAIAMRCLIVHADDPTGFHLPIWQSDTSRAACAWDPRRQSRRRLYRHLGGLGPPSAPWGKRRRTRPAS
jgi:hypothetical protein